MSSAASSSLTPPGARKDEDRPRFFDLRPIACVGPTLKQCRDATLTGGARTSPTTSSVNASAIAKAAFVLRITTLFLILKRRAQEGGEGAARYVRMEQRVGKFMWNFHLPENANIEKILEVFQDGVLTVAVEKLPPPKPKKPRTIVVKHA